MCFRDVVEGGVTSAGLGAGELRCGTSKMRQPNPHLDDLLLQLILCHD